MKYKSKKGPRKPHVWVTEISVKDRNETKALRELVELVRRYEEIS